MIGKITTFLHIDCWQACRRNGGADALDGGTGTDAADYSGSAAGVTVDLATGTGTGGDAEGDTLSGIENLLGSGLADMLTGNDTLREVALANEKAKSAAGKQPIRDVIVVPGRLVNVVTG